MKISHVLLVKSHQITIFAGENHHFGCLNRPKVQFVVVNLLFPTVVHGQPRLRRVASGCFGPQ